MTLPFARPLTHPPASPGTLFGRKADKRRKLYNGGLECQYYQYRPYKGADR